MTKQEFDELCDAIEKPPAEVDELKIEITRFTGLRRQIQDIRTAARLITSNAWTPEAREYVNAVVDGAAPALKSLNDKMKALQIQILKHRLNALEAQHDRQADDDQST